MDISSPYVAYVPNEKRVPILSDLIQCYQAKFGPEWLANLRRNLTPSPVRELAAKHGVSLNAVRSLKHTLWILGSIASAQAETQAETQLFTL